MIRRHCSGDFDSSNNHYHQDIKRQRSGPPDSPPQVTTQNQSSSQSIFQNGAAINRTLPNHSIPPSVKKTPTDTTHMTETQTIQLNPNLLCSNNPAIVYITRNRRIESSRNLPDQAMPNVTMQSEPITESSSIEKQAMENQTIPQSEVQNHALTNPSEENEADQASESTIQSDKMENITVQNPAMQNQDTTTMENLRTAKQETGKSAPNLEWDPLPDISCPSTSRYWVLYMENVRRDKMLRRRRLAQKREENIDDFLRRFPVE